MAERSIKSARLFLPQTRSSRLRFTCDVSVTFRQLPHPSATFEYDGHDRLAKTRYPVAAVGASASSTTEITVTGKLP
jgi:hypothetical protein